MNTHSPEYVAYLKSAKWKKMRDGLLKLADYRCQACRKYKLPSKLHIHHLTYERLGHELFADVMVLCEICHEQADTIRKRAREEQYEERRYESRLNGWASKVYGDEWYHGDSERIAEEFDAWLEAHDDESGQ